MRKAIVYEQPLNERMRTCLRLELLFQQAAHRLTGASPWDSRATLGSLLEILEILNRGDLKTELIKELDRVQGSLSRLRTVAGVDQNQLNELLSQLAAYQERLYRTTVQLGQALREHEFFATLRQRSSVPGGMSACDLPAYHHWLCQPGERRSRDLTQWFNSLDNVREPVELLLELVRRSTDPVYACASQGFYQQTLDSETPYQLIRVSLPAEADCFAEISAGRHRFSIRFLQSRENARPIQVSDEVDFQLCCCAL